MIYDLLSKVEIMTNERFFQILNCAFNMGQTYWQQADSELKRYHRMADETFDKFQIFKHDAWLELERDMEQHKQG